MIEVFKTNVTQHPEAEQLLTVLSNTFTSFQFHFDLEDCDNILRAEGHPMASEAIIALLQSNGYNCEIVP